MIGGDIFYLGSWDQYASCISTSKVGRRQPISLLSKDALPLHEASLTYRFSVEGD